MLNIFFFSYIKACFLPNLSFSWHVFVLFLALEIQHSNIPIGCKWSIAWENGIRSLIVNLCSWKGKDLNPDYEHPKKVDCQGRRLWDLLGKLCLFTCSEWASEEYIGEPCNGSLCVFLDFFFFFFVGSSHVFSVHWMWNFCEFVVLLYPSKLFWAGGWWYSKARDTNFWWKRSEKCATYSSGQNTLNQNTHKIIFYVMWLFRGI